MRTAVYLVVVLLGLPAFGLDSKLSGSSPEELIHSIDAYRKETPLMELPWTIVDLYIAGKKITEYPNCSGNEGLNAVFECLWQKLGNGTQMPNSPIAIADALFDILRAEQVTLQAAIDSRKEEETESAASAVLSSFHNDLCTKGDDLLRQLNSRRALESLTSGQRFLLNTYLELSLSNNKEEQTKVFCTSSKAALLLKARLQ